MIEAFCRINTSGQRKQLAERWFSSGPVRDAFVKIKDSEFETVMFFLKCAQVYHSQISFTLTTLELHDWNVELFFRVFFYFFFFFYSFILGLSQVFKLCK